MAAIPPSVFKIFHPEEWKLFQERGVFTGSSDDQRDGFIHLSTEQQVPGTLDKHYRGAPRIVLARIATAGLPIVMEPSRDAQLFPHLYGDLPLSAVEASEQRMLD